MNESDARSALLVRAYETLPVAQNSVHWTENDRHWATQAAQRSEGEQASTGIFIARRARLAAERLCLRDHDARRVLRALTWRPWLGSALALAAFIAGIATDAIAPARQINVLSPPLLAVLAWNLAVYAALVASATRRPAGNRLQRVGPIARQIARVAHAVTSARSIAMLTPPLAGFVRDWAVASAPLTLSRVARILHVAAMAFAGGALLGLYIRGFAFEYRAGWESTFLDAPAIHAILLLVLGPASVITGITLPDAVQLAAIRLPLSQGENAARWIHLYAVTVALIVLVPRAVMALGHFLVERRLVNDLPLSIDDGYFQGLARAHRGDVARVHVVPYSYRPSPQATLGLNALMAGACGLGTQVTVTPPTPFGEEDALDPELVPHQPVALVAAMFSLTATPERENHGVFIEALCARLPPSTPLAILVDESAFRQRFDAPDAAGAARLRERREAWHRLLAETRRVPVFVDLERHDFTDAGRALQAAIDHAAACAAPD